MEIKIDFTKSAQENANDYYSRAKRLIQKRAGAEKAIKDLEKKLKVEESKEKEQKKRIMKVVKREWYEAFRWFFTSNNMMVIGGRDAHQNELLNSKHFGEKDLFLHANIFGAPVTILKDGVDIPAEIKEEAAQFAASYSSAWEEGLRSIDVYAMRRNQVSKSSEKGSLGTGSFLLKGERDWYRNIELSLVMFIKDDRLNTVPSKTFAKFDGMGKHVILSQGDLKKSDAGKKIAAYFQLDDLDNIIRQLPTGSFSLKME
ncbi:MAG TPA: NFACT family protein [Candidatus Acidoferrales bacterium]|nr:NFACT family protein [Candidatus Acidoferrales bacterium]